MAMLKNAYEHLQAIQLRLNNNQSDMFMPWVGYTWMLKYVEQDWPWSTMALKPSSKFDENGKKIDILFKINGEYVKEMRLCVSFDDIREDRAGNEPPFFFVLPASFGDYMDLNNCKYCSHCLLLPIESPEERLKLVSDKEWFNSFQKLNKFDGVKVFHDDEWHPARLRYEGSLAILDRPEGPEGVMQPRGDEVDGGTFFGVELLRGSVGKGNTDGFHYGQERTGALTEKKNGFSYHKFTCEPNCGLFVTARKIKAAPGLLTRQEKKAGVEIGLRAEETKCRERKALQEELKKTYEGKTPEEIRAMKRLETTEYGKVVNHKPIAVEVDGDVNSFVYNESMLFMFRDMESTRDEVGGGGDPGNINGDGFVDISINEFRAIRKQFHIRHIAKMKKYHHNLEGESDEE